MGFHRANENERCDTIVPNHAALYTTVIERGVGIPLHLFFMDVLVFYNLAPAQLSLVAWCHMLGTLILFHQEDMGVPTLMEWHHFYHLENIFGEGNLFYFTKWPGGEAPLIVKPPSNI